MENNSFRKSPWVCQKTDNFNLKGGCFIGVTTCVFHQMTPFILLLKEPCGDACSRYITKLWVFHCCFPGEGEGLDEGRKKRYIKYIENFLFDNHACALLFMPILFFKHASFPQGVCLAQITPGDVFILCVASYVFD